MRRRTLPPSTTADRPNACPDRPFTAARPTARPLWRALPALVAACLAAPLAGCGAGSATGDDPDRVDVVAGFYPLQFVTERVGGDAVAVTSLAKPGAEPHDLELSPVQVGQISDAELIVYLAGFQPAVDDAVAQEGGDRGLDAAAAVSLLAAAGGDGHDDEPADRQESGHGKDLHFWLDPVRLAGLGNAVAERLGRLDPDRAADYRTRAAALRKDLTVLDREYAEGLNGCQRRELVVSHAAFGYLAERYGLEQIGISGLSPEDEPSPRRLAEVAAQAREHGATTVFFETLVSPKVAETIAREVGADTAVLDPLEGLQPGSTADYLAVMRKNLAVLRPALGCP